jgi:hypothetical protein
MIRPQLWMHSAENQMSRAPRGRIIWRTEERAMNGPSSFHAESKLQAKCKNPPSYDKVTSHFSGSSEALRNILVRRRPSWTKRNCLIMLPQSQKDIIQQWMQAQWCTSYYFGTFGWFGAALLSAFSLGVENQIAKLWNNGTWTNWQHKKGLSWEVSLNFPSTSKQRQRPNFAREKWINKHFQLNFDLGLFQSRKSEIASQIRRAIAVSKEKCLEFQRNIMFFPTLICPNCARQSVSRDYLIPSISCFQMIWMFLNIVQLI